MPSMAASMQLKLARAEKERKAKEKNAAKLLLRRKEANILSVIRRLSLEGADAEDEKARDRIEMKESLQHALGLVQATLSFDEDDDDHMPKPVTRVRAKPGTSSLVQNSKGSDEVKEILVYLA